MRRPTVGDDVGAAFLASGSRSPARSTVEARSDLTFVTDIESALSAEFSEETARSAALAVLCSPTVAARKNVGDGERAIVQSLVLEGAAQDFAVQVTVHLRALPGKPGAAKLEQARAAHVDLDDVQDRLTLVRAVESWWAEYPMPALKVPEPFPLRDWAWLGDPNHVGILEAPANWRDLVSRIGAVYGVPPLIADTVDRLRTWKLEDRIGHAVVVRGTKWASNFPPEGTDRDIEISQVGYSGERFDTVLGEVRALMLSEALAADAPTPASRDLEPGEVTYHRKVGNSRKFDRFDVGSAEPCTHGAGAYKHWDGDKAIKGMMRRYDNFASEMLIHCSKYPNCGMYGVDASRGGLRRSSA